ncbi:DALR anticodon-binding domain-containing protein [Marinactinospora rubrisoli]|uniref:DALR anticodon-binding domain-containing protein n=1 Tax=Marinactinospora rubrisoli TaxID=2715399 RepID=A0ABW2KA58_9ACTN
MIVDALAGLWREEGATPLGVDALLRSAAAGAAGLAPEAVPGAEPYRVPAGRPGDYATALAQRLARRAGGDPRTLAAGIAAEARRRPDVLDARVEGNGFVNLTVTGTARARSVRAAVRGLPYLRGPATLRTAAPAPPAAGAAAADDGIALSDLSAAADLPAARRLARDDARRRIALALTGHPGVGLDAAAVWPVRAHLDPGTGDVTWRDPPPDTAAAVGGDAASAAEPARLLAVIGEATARIAFCRSAAERPRAGELTGPGLPALPTPEHPGAWARQTDANPAFGIRYAHAHAVRSREWIADAARAAGAEPPPGAPFAAFDAPAAVAVLTAPPAAALLGALFDGPGHLAGAGRRREPHILVRYLEGLAAAYHDWRETWGTSTGEHAGTTAHDAGRCCRDTIAARSALCAAAAAVLAAGLSLLGAAAPTRL